jgi:hypothetical protein
MRLDWKWALARPAEDSLAEKYLPAAIVHVKVNTNSYPKNIPKEIMSKNSHCRDTS